MSFIIASLFVSQVACAELTKTEAREAVKIFQCADGYSIDDALKKKIKSHSQRDLGWKVFQKNNQLDVVRVILINKGMRVNYHWRIDTEGHIKPIGKRAKRLCTA